MLWWILAVVAGLIVIDLAIRLFALTVILPIFERKPPFGVKPTDPHPAAEPISFPTTNGLTLRGAVYRHNEQPSRGLVVFCHETDGSHWSAMTYGPALWEAGFDMLAFDFRNQGDSDGLPDYDPLHWLTQYEVDDLKSALAYIKTRPELASLPLGFFGISRGGSAALAVAAQVPEVRCVACESSFSTDSVFMHFTLRWAAVYIPEWSLKLIPMWHLRSTLAFARWISQFRRHCRYITLERWLPLLGDRPVLMIAGESDSYVHPDVAKQVFNAIGNSPVPNELWLVRRAKHNGSRLIEPEEYDRRLVAHFSKMGVGTKLGIAAHGE